MTLTAHPDAEHTFVAWGGDVTGSNTTTTVTMSGHRRFVAVFRADDSALGPRITAIDRTVVPVGDTMVFSGQGLTNATDVIIHWSEFEHPALFSIVSNADLIVTMPTVRQDVRAHYASVRTPQGSTVGIPPDTYEFSGAGSLPAPFGHDAVRVLAGAVLTYDMEAANQLVYVDAGGILECTGDLSSPLVFAEGGALLDFSGITTVAGGVFYVSPDTVVVGAMPTSDIGGDGTVTELTCISAGPGIALIYVGFPLAVTVEGPGSVGVIPDKPLYAFGQDVQLTAAPATNCFFVRWLGDAQGVQSGTTVRVRNSTAVTARFSATPDYFRTWRPIYFTPEEMADLEISGADADPDHDGYTTAAEYLFGSNPRASEDARRIHVLVEEINDKACAFVQYVRPAMAADAQYHIEVSQDLVTWRHNGDGTETVYSRETAHEDIGEDLEQVTAQLLPDSPLPAMVFSRIHATLFE